MKVEAIFSDQEFVSVTEDNNANIETRGEQEILPSSIRKNFEQEGGRTVNISEHNRDDVIKCRESVTVEEQAETVAGMEGKMIHSQTKEWRKETFHTVAYPGGNTSVSSMEGGNNVKQRHNSSARRKKYNTFIEECLYQDKCKRRKVTKSYKGQFLEDLGGEIMLKDGKINTQTCALHEGRKPLAMDPKVKVNNEEATVTSPIDMIDTDTYMDDVRYEIDNETLDESITPSAIDSKVEVINNEACIISSRKMNNSCKEEVKDEKKGNPNVLDKTMKNHPSYKMLCYQAIQEAPKKLGDIYSWIAARYTRKELKQSHSKAAWRGTVRSCLWKGKQDRVFRQDSNSYWNLVQDGDQENNVGKSQEIEGVKLYVPSLKKEDDKGYLEDIIGPSSNLQKGVWETEDNEDLEEIVEDIVDGFLFQSSFKMFEL